jgi:uncharacterized protein HemY
MYNLLIAIGVASLAFGLGFVVTGTPVAGILPGLIALGVAYIFLARRTGKQFQVVMEKAAAEFQAGKVEPGLRLMESCFKYAKWQFFVGPQIHGQIGMLLYLQRKWKPARTHLSQAWKRDWRARTMLAALDHREGRKEAALELMGKLTGFGGKDPVFWALYAYIALEAKQRDKALSIVNDGLKKCSDSNGLKDLQTSIANKKKLKMKAFAPTWYQYFPEQMPRSQMQKYSNQQPGMRYPQPRR